MSGDRVWKGCASNFEGHAFDFDLGLDLGELVGWDTNFEMTLNPGVTIRENEGINFFKAFSKTSLFLADVL